MEKSRTHPGGQAPGAIHERILRALGMARRPLQSGEIENALGLVTTEAKNACSWLSEQGYIIGTAREASSSRRDVRARTSWTLADKGCDWAKGQDALAV